MANIVTENDRIALASVETPFCLELDGHSGLPVGLSTEAGSGVVHWPIHCTARVEVGGTEKRDPTGGIAYEGTVSLTDLWVAQVRSLSRDGVARARRERTAAE